MEKVYKHRKTGELAYYKDGVFKQGRFCVEIGVEPSSEFWTELSYKEPILTTFDGVELFGGESIYSVTDDFQLCYTSIATKENIQGIRVFAKMENAQEYILMNKSLLSLNDLLSVWSTDGLYDVYKESPMFQNFKNLAKTKL